MKNGLQVVVYTNKSASSWKQAARKLKSGPEGGTAAKRQRQDHWKKLSTTNRGTRKNLISYSEESESESVQATVAVAESTSSKKRAASKRKAGKRRRQRLNKYSCSPQQCSVNVTTSQNASSHYHNERCTTLY